MRVLAAFAVLVLAPLVAGCDAAGPVSADAPLRAGGVSLTADRDAYRSGETIELTLVNGASRELTTGVLECAALERWSGRAWETSRAGNDRACIEIALVLDPGGTSTGEARVRVPSGSYRFTHWVALNADSRRVATGAFRIR